MLCNCAKHFMPGKQPCTALAVVSLISFLLTQVHICKADT